MRFGIFRGGRPGRTASQQSGNRGQADASPHRHRSHGDRTALAIGQPRSGLRANGRKAGKIAAPAQAPQSDEAHGRIETRARRAEAQTKRAQTRTVQVESGGCGLNESASKSSPDGLLPPYKRRHRPARDGRRPKHRSTSDRISKHRPDSLSAQDVLRDREAHHQS